MKQEKIDEFYMIARRVIEDYSVPESAKTLIANSITLELQTAYLDGRNDEVNDMLTKLNLGIKLSTIKLNPGIELSMAYLQCRLNLLADLRALAKNKLRELNDE
jgi:hypothetical protein